MAFGDAIRRFLTAIDGASRVSTERVSGPPTSSNGASSMHLFWTMPTERSDDPVVAAEVTIEVVAPPPAGRLCFWALQASFTDGRTALGAGHLGLQHHPDYPDRCAVNWGGYHDAASGRTGELPGSALGAPSSLSNPNTCNFRWGVGRPYRYRIAPSPDGGWRGSIADADGVEFIIRDLDCGGDRLTGLMVWTESFARCDDPVSAVRWSDLRAITASGRTVRPAAVRVNYQRVADGGCSNTTVELADAAEGGPVIEQRTNSTRVIAQGTVVALRV